MKCKCGEKTTGWTTVKCCNICGLPIPEEVWDIPKTDEAKSEVRVEAPVKHDLGWTKKKPNKPCVFMTRMWNKQLKIYDYNIWRLIVTNGESLEDATYLGWFTEDGDEWDDYSECNFDEYKILGKV